MDSVCCPDGALGGSVSDSWLTLRCAGVPRITALVAFAFYLLVSFLLFGLPVIGSPTHAHIGYMSDQGMMMWCMVWWPYALAHGINPFITHAVWAPSGFNLTWSASIPALAAAFTPVTMAWGPVVSYNLAALLGPALSAWAAFLVCRHVAQNVGGALAGGMLYGFSPYQVGHVLAGHLNLTSVFVPPFCVLLVLLLVEDEVSSGSFAIGLVLLLVLQCLISTEVLATMTLFGGLALLAALALMPYARSRLLAAAIPIGSAYAAAAIILAPFLYYLLAKGSAPRAAIFPSSLFSSDLLSFFIPPRWLLIYPRAAAALDSRLVADINFWEKGSYFSLPLVAVAGLYFWPRRSQAIAQLLVVLFLLVAVAALGPVLHVDGRPLVVLPWAVGDELPLIKHALPIRFANYGFLILAIIVSLWLSGPRIPFRPVLAVAVLLALFPNPVFLLKKSVYHVPAFFADGLYHDYLRPGDNVLIIPYGDNGASMAWQAETWMYFRMAGGYLGFTPEKYRRWPIVSTLITSLAVPDPALQLRAFVAGNSIDAIIVADSAKGIASELPQSAGLPGVKIGGVVLYRMARNPSPAPPLERLQLAAADWWFSKLLCASHRFLAGGGDIGELNPVRARMLGLLPDSKWGKRLDLVIAGASHGAYNGLWIGPGDNGLLEAGMFASSAVIGPLTAHYGSDLTSVLYPYPHRYRAGVPSDESVDFLLMTFRSESAGRFCPGPVHHSAAVKPSTSTSDTMLAPRGVSLEE